ncbi:MAG: plastocyanin/azurin family copper-binding protein, partial [Gemmatimonadaceae bacterium]
MRFLGLAVIASAALALGACGGKGADRTNDSANEANKSANPAPAGAATAAMAMKPITGTTHEIKMIGDEKGYRFDPAETTIKAGDGVKFIMVTGGPHNVAFDETNINATAKSQLIANMGPDVVSELSS